MKQKLMISIVTPLLAIGFNSILNAQTLTHTIDFETGNYNQGNTDACGNKNTGCDCGIGTSLKIITSNPSPRAGTNASKSRVVDCHERAEMKISGILTGNTNWWVGWSIYIPNDYVKSEGGIITQFHDILGGGGQNNNPCPDYTRGGPSLFKFNSNGILQFAMRHQKSGCNSCLARTVFDSLQNIEDMRGKWTDFVLNANFSCNASNGFIKLWIRQADETWPAKPKIDYTGSTFPDKGSSTAGPNFRTGLYFGNPDKVGGNIMVIYMDEMKAGKEIDGVGFNDVEPGATTGISMLTPDSDNKIYPVPCSECYIELNPKWIGASIEITNLIGTTICSDEYMRVGQKLKIDSHFKGVAIIRIEKNGQLMRQKIIVV